MSKSRSCMPWCREDGSARVTPVLRNCVAVDAQSRARRPVVLTSPQAHSTRPEHVHVFVPKSPRKSCARTLFDIGRVGGTREILNTTSWKLGFWNWHIRSHSVVRHVAGAGGTRLSYHSRGADGGKPHGILLSKHVDLCEI